MNYLRVAAIAFVALTSMLVGMAIGCEMQHAANAEMFRNVLQIDVAERNRLQQRIDEYEENKRWYYLHLALNNNERQELKDKLNRLEDYVANRETYRRAVEIEDLGQ